MAILTAAVVLVGLLCVVDLLLTLAVIRRLRTHTEQLATLRDPAADNPFAGMVAAGSPVPAFTGRSVDGVPVDVATAQPELIVFFSTSCSACATELPELVALLGSGAHEGRRAVVIVAGQDNAGSVRFVDALRPVATVVREPFGGPILTAFAVDVYPTFYVVADGVVRGRAISVRGLAELSGVA